MPREDSLPDSRRRGIYAIIVAFVIALLVVTLLTRVPFRSEAPQGATTPRYSNQTIELTPPVCPNSNGSYDNLSLGHTSFSLRLVDYCTLGSQVNGSGSEDAGATFWFQIGGAAHSSTGWLNWTSPDHAFGVDYDQQFTVQLWTDSYRHG